TRIVMRLCRRSQETLPTSSEEILKDLNAITQLCISTLLEISANSDGGKRIRKRM
ncbi:4119_t:CDS:1, partial [Paraglomus occultum]